MASTFTPNKYLEEPANGDYTNDWNVPCNANWTAVDTALGGLTNINAVGASGVAALTYAQYRPPMWVITGAITANINYQLPANVGGRWSIYNNTTGAFTITVSSATGGGGSVAIPQGQRLAVACDGTNVTADSTVMPSTGAITWTGTQTIEAGAAASGSNYLILSPTDYGAGKPELYFQKNSSASSGWTMGCSDGSSTYGLTLNFSTLSINGSGGGQINYLPNAGTGSYNSTNIAGDCAIVGTTGAVNSGFLNLTTWSNTAVGVRISAAGSVVITGTVSTTGNLSVPSFTVTSDRRLKSRISPLARTGYVIDRIGAYAYTKGGRREWGVLAQEVLSVAPDLVTSGADEMLEVNYLGLVAALLAETQQLRLRVAKLEGERRPWWRLWR